MAAPKLRTEMRKKKAPDRWMTDSLKSIESYVVCEQHNTIVVHFASFEMGQKRKVYFTLY